MADPRKTFVYLAGKDSADVVVYLRPSAGLAMKPPGMKCPNLIQWLRRATVAISDMVQAISRSPNELHGHLKDVNILACAPNGWCQRMSRAMPDSRRRSMLLLQQLATGYRHLLIYNNSELFFHRRPTITRRNSGISRFFF